MLVNDLSIAEDLAHDIFLRVYRSKNFRISSPQFRNYIKKAARNIVADYLKITARNEAKNRKMIPVLKNLDETIYSSLESGVIEGEVLSTVHDVLDEFSERSRKIFTSRMFEQKTLKQVSEEEKISSYTIKRVENEILNILRKKLKIFFD
jgi:RNA polymerase sigma-70 factor (ECF subfamily)